MTIRTILACWAAMAGISHAAAEQPQEKERQKPLEQPPAFSEGAPSGADETERAKSLEQPPSLSERREDEELEPTITIKQQADVTIYEYRLNGLLYGIKVVPKNAPGYYLIDTDGDGFMDRRRHDLTSPEVNRIPAWVFFRW